MKRLLFFLFLLISFWVEAQEKTSNYKKKRLAVKDTIIIDSVSINPSRFIVKNKGGEIIDASRYTIDFETSIFHISGQNLGP